MALSVKNLLSSGLGRQEACEYFMLWGKQVKTELPNCWSDSVGFVWSARSIYWASTLCGCNERIIPFNQDPTHEVGTMWGFVHSSELQLACYCQSTSRVHYLFTSHSLPPAQGVELGEGDRRAWGPECRSPLDLTGYGFPSSELLVSL